MNPVHGTSIDEWVRGCQFFRLNCILFGKLFEFDEDQNMDLYHKKKLSLITEANLEQLFHFLTVDYPEYCSRQHVSRRIAKEIDHLYYCLYSALLNYFICLKSGSAGAQINPKVYEVAERQLLMFVQRVATPEIATPAAFEVTEVQEEDETDHGPSNGQEKTPKQAKLDISVFSETVDKLSQLLTLLIDLCPKGAIKGVSQFKTQVIRQLTSGSDRFHGIHEHPCQVRQVEPIPDRTVIQTSRTPQSQVRGRLDAGRELE